MKTCKKESDANFHVNQWCISDTVILIYSYQLPGDGEKKVDVNLGCELWEFKQFINLKKHIVKQLIGKQ